MADQIFPFPAPGIAQHELAGIDLDRLPLTPPDPLREYYQPMASGAWSLRSLQIGRAHV